MTSYLSVTSRKATATAGAGACEWGIGNVFGQVGHKFKPCAIGCHQMPERSRQTVSCICVTCTKQKSPRSRRHAHHNITPQLHCSRIRTALPGLFSAQRKHPGTSKLCRPTRVNGLPRSETVQNPLPEHTHASQNHSRSKPLQIGGTEQMEAHLGSSLVDAVHADFTRSSFRVR